MGDSKDVLLDTFCSLFPEGFVPVGALERNTLIFRRKVASGMDGRSSERWKRCQGVTSLSGAVSCLGESAVEILLRQTPVKYSSSLPEDGKI